MEMTKANRETTLARLSLLHFTAETARNPTLHLWEEAYMLRATKCHLQREQGESHPSRWDEADNSELICMSMPPRSFTLSQNTDVITPRWSRRPSMQIISGFKSYNV